MTTPTPASGERTSAPSAPRTGDALARLRAFIHLHIRDFSLFLALQVLSKVLLLAQGLLIINLLGKSDYGLYALVLAIVFAVANISNAGVGMYIAAAGGKHISDPLRIRSVLAAANLVQNRLLAICLAALAIILPLQCLALGLGTAEIVTIGSLGLLTLFFQVKNTINKEIMAVALMIKRNQLVDLTMTSGRILAYLALYACHCFDIRSILLTAIATSLACWLIQTRFIATLSDPGNSTPPLGDDVRQARRTVYPQLPNAIYSSVQSQIPYFLMGYFGTVTTIASFSALGRLSLLVSFLFDIFNDFFIPRISRCQDGARLAILILRILATLYLAIAAILGIAYALRHQILWLLGPQYANLDFELTLIFITTGVSAVSGSLFLVNSARAWVHHSWIFIVCNIACTVGALPFVNLSRIADVIIYANLPHIPFIITNILFMRNGLRRLRTDAQ
jgi:O-antigen/teichoic acid export membrane protein